MDVEEVGNVLSANAHRQLEVDSRVWLVEIDRSSLFPRQLFVVIALLGDVADEIDLFVAPYVDVRVADVAKNHFACRRGADAALPVAPPFLDDKVFKEGFGHGVCGGGILVNGHDEVAGNLKLGNEIYKVEGNPKEVVGRLSGPVGAAPAPTSATATATTADAMNNCGYAVLVLPAQVNRRMPERI